MRIETENSEREDWKERLRIWELESEHWELRFGK